MSWKSEPVPAWIDYEFDPPVFIKPLKFKPFDELAIPKRITVIDMLTGEEEDIDLTVDDT